MEIMFYHAQKTRLIRRRFTIDIVFEVEINACFVYLENFSWHEIVKYTELMGLGHATLRVPPHPSFWAD